MPPPKIGPMRLLGTTSAFPQAIWDVKKPGSGAVGTRPEIIAADDQRADLFERLIAIEIADTRIRLDAL
jgi:hypothetical protein